MSKQGKAGKQNKDNSSEGAESQAATNGDIKVKHYAAPEGYEQQSGDITGFWDPENGPLHFIPLHVNIFDSQIEETKSSTLVIGRLIDPTELLKPGSDGDVVRGHKDDLVGVWAKPGMQGLKNTAGVPVFMYMTGEERDTGKPNPMKLFAIFAKQKGQELPVEADRREKSKYAKALFAPKPVAKKAAPTRPEVPEEGAEDVPF